MTEITPLKTPEMQPKSTGRKIAEGILFGVDPTPKGWEKKIMAGYEKFVEPKLKDKTPEELDALHDKWEQGAKIAGWGVTAAEVAGIAWGGNKLWNARAEKIRSLMRENNTNVTGFNRLVVESNNWKKAHVTGPASEIPGKMATFTDKAKTNIQADAEEITRQLQDRAIVAQEKIADATQPLRDRVQKVKDTVDTTIATTMDRMPGQQDRGILEGTIEGPALKPAINADAPALHMTGNAPDMEDPAFQAEKQRVISAVTGSHDWTGYGEVPGYNPKTGRVETGSPVQPAEVRKTGLNDAPPEVPVQTPPIPSAKPSRFGWVTSTLGRFFRGGKA